MGQQNSETAVEVINEKSTRISNKRDGVVYQVFPDRFEHLDESGV